MPSPGKSAAGPSRMCSGKRNRAYPTPPGKSPAGCPTYESITGKPRNSQVLLFPKKSNELRHIVGDKPGLGFQGLPHIRVKRSLSDIAVDRYLLVLIAEAENAALALLDLGGLPGGVEMVQRHQAFLHVGAGAHLGRAADQYSDLAAAYLVEQCLFLGVGVGVSDRGNLLTGDAAA